MDTARSKMFLNFRLPRTVGESRNKKIKKPLDKQLNKCYNGYSQEGVRTQLSSRKQQVGSLRKKFENPLDKPKQVCYN